MTERYIWKQGQWISKKTGEPMEAPDRVCAPLIQSDIAPYMSVVSNKVIDGRKDRREDLKRSGCREVDPSEGLPGVRSEKWAKRLKMPIVDLSEKRLTDQT